MKNIIGVYSKNSEYTGFPQYYEKSKNVEIKIDNKKYLDFSTMFLGCNLLGYADKNINNAIIKRIKSGSNSTLCCQEEKEFSEEILKLHSWADSIRFSKTGGEAMAIALKIAQMNTNKKGIINCGYSGWHIKNLNTKQFEFNNIKSFRETFDKDKDGIVIMEIIRGQLPSIDWVYEIMETCKQTRTILIFDEITSGFRFNLGGYHLSLYKQNEYIKNTPNGEYNLIGKINIIPDLCVFGKAISNGNALSCVIGKKEIMDNGEEAFISSTFFTEGIGFAAGMETIRQLKKQDYQYLWNLGKAVQNIWLKYAKKYNIDIEINSVPQLLHFKFKEYHQEKLTIFVNLMKENEFIANNLFTPCFKHLPKHILLYEKACEKVFDIIGHLDNKVLNDYIQLNKWKIIKEFPINIKRD